MSVFVTVHLRSKKLGLNGMPKEQLPSVRAAMKSRGHLLVPFAAVIYLIIRQYTISFAALVGIILVLVISPLKKETRMSWKQIATAFVDGGQENRLLRRLLRLRGHDHRRDHPDRRGQRPGQLHSGYLSGKSVFDSDSGHDHVHHHGHGHARPWPYTSCRLP